MMAHEEPLRVTVIPRPESGDFIAVSPQMALPAPGATPKEAALEMGLRWFFGERLGSLFTREEAVARLELQVWVVAKPETATEGTEHTEGEERAMK